MTCAAPAAAGGAAAEGVLPRWAPLAAAAGAAALAVCASKLRS